jgi:hypothetical protein
MEFDPRNHDDLQRFIRRSPVVYSRKRSNHWYDQAEVAIIQAWVTEQLGEGWRKEERQQRKATQKKDPAWFVWLIDTNILPVVVWLLGPLYLLLVGWPFAEPIQWVAGGFLVVVWTIFVRYMTKETKTEDEEDDGRSYEVLQCGGRRYEVLAEPEPLSVEGREAEEDG